MPPLTRFIPATPTTLLIALLIAGPAPADLITIGSGDWFNADLWEDPFGNNQNPNDSTQNPVRIKDGHTISITAGVATTANELDVGHATTGTLNLSAGGNLEPGQRLHIGDNGADGSLNMTGGTITTPVVLVGRSFGSDGTLDLDDGTISTSFFSVGSSGADGTLDMSGGAITTNTFNISDVGTGTINQSSGSITTFPPNNGPAPETVIGSTTVSTADINLSGDAIWALAGAVRMRGGALSLSGDSNITTLGTLRLNNADLSLSGNASVNTAAINLVGRTASQTRATLTLDGGTLSTADSLNIGSDAIFTVSATAGTLSAGRALIFGTNQNGEANATFTGGTVEVRADSTSTDLLGDVFVGLLGDAIVEFGGTSQLTFPGTLNIGVGEASDSAFTASGDSTITAGGRVDVGTFGKGALTIEGNASLTAPDFLVVGANAGSDASFDMAGGTLELTGTSGTLITGLDGIGLTAIGPGTVTANNILTGARSRGDLIIRDGADITLTGSFVLASESGSAATLDMTGGTVRTTTSTGDFRVGENGPALANLRGTANITAQDDILIAPFAGGEGTLNLAGEATLSCVDDLRLAAESTATTARLVLGENARLNVGDRITAAAEPDTDVLIELDGNAVIDSPDICLLGDAEGVRCGLRLGLRGGDPLFRCANRISFPAFNADESEIFFQIFSGTLEGTRVELGNSTVDDTTQTFDIVGGTVRSTTSVVSLEGEGAVFTMSNGVVEGGTGVEIGSGVHFDGFTMTQSGGLITSPVDVALFDSSGANGTYRLVGDGRITAPEVSIGDDRFESDSTFTQTSGAITATDRFHNRGATGHVMTGGTLTADRFDMVGAPPTGGFFGGPGTIATMEQTGGTVTASTSASFENASLQLSGGTMELASARLGTSASTTADLLLSAHGTFHVSGPFTVGHPSGQHTRARVTQSGGNLVTDGTFTLRGEYPFTAGNLTRSTPGNIAVTGNLTLTENATLLLENDKRLQLTGTLTSTDSDAQGNFRGGGAIDVSGLQLTAVTGVTQFIPLGTVSNTANLGTDTALDEIAILNLGGANATRVTEAAFESDQFSGNAMALVEGQNTDGDGIIGIAYRLIEAGTAPVANPDTLVRLAGQPGSITTAQLLANDTPENGGTLTFVNAASQSAELQPVTHDGTTVTYSPDPAFNGPDTFTYLVSNGDVTAIGTVNVVVVDPAADDDGDGMDNAYELEHFGSTTAGDPAADPDRDGRTNLEESIALTDPNDPADRFGATLETDGTTLTVRVPSHPDRTYQLHAGDDPAALLPVGDPVHGDGTTLTFQHPNTGTRTFLNIAVRKP